MPTLIILPVNPGLPSTNSHHFPGYITQIASKQPVKGERNNMDCGLARMIKPTREMESGLRPKVPMLDRQAGFKKAAREEGGGKQGSLL